LLASKEKESPVVRFGRHMPRPLDALARAQDIGCDAVQIFVTNPRAWQPPAPDPAAAEAFRAEAAAHDQRPVVVHAAYIINLASSNDDLFERSIGLLRVTLERAAAFGAASVVFHVGSHTGAGEEAGLVRLIEGLRRVLAQPLDGVRLLLENDTGGGGKIGYRFENLARVLDALPEHAQRLGVCLDTAHLWGAHFDIGTPEGARQALDDADRILGLGRVPVLHVNDARAGRGAHLDRHARLGEGEIALEGLAAFLRDPRLAHTAALLETPFFEQESGKHDWAAEREHMAKARALAGLSMPPDIAVTAPAAAATSSGA
jgi:deoxyribonuclease IV